MSNITQSGYQYQRLSEENPNQLAMTNVIYHLCPRQSYPSLSTITRVQPMYCNIHNHEQTVRPSISHGWTIASTHLLSMEPMDQHNRPSLQYCTPAEIDSINEDHHLTETLLNQYTHQTTHMIITKQQNEKTKYIVYITSEMLITHNTSFKYISSSL